MNSFVKKFLRNSFENRKANKEEILDFYRRYDDDDDLADTEKMLDNILKDKGNFFGAFRNRTEIVGMLILIPFNERFKDDPLKNGTLIVQNFYVLEEFRNRGIGRSLLTYVMEVFSPSPIALFVADDNERAFKMYTSMGFEYSYRVNEHTCLIYDRTKK